MCSNQDKPFIQILKDHLIAAHYFDTTVDDFIDLVREIYVDVFFEKIIKFSTHLKQKYPNVDEEKHKEIMKTLFETFDTYLKEYLNYLENYAAESVFRIPKHVELEQDSEINEALRGFSKEEDDELNKNLDEKFKVIEQKREYINFLESRLAKYKLIEKAWSLGIDLD